MSRMPKIRLTYLLLTPLLFAVAAFTAVTAHSGVRSNEKQLTFGKAIQMDASTDGAAVVYTDWRSGDPDIYIFDNSVGVAEPLVKGSSSQTQPDIGGGLVAYVDTEAGSQDIWLYSLSDASVTRLTYSPAADRDPAVSTDAVVFVTGRAGDNDVYIYMFDGAVVAPFAAGPGEQTAPDIDGDLVVWQDSSNPANSDDIYARRLTGELTPVAVGPGSQRTPSVSGGLIAYIDAPEGAEGPGDVAVYDMSDGTVKKITSDPFDQRDVIISGRTLVWADNRGGNYALYMHDLDEGVTLPLTSSPSDKWLTGLSGSTAVYHDKRTGELNVWRMDFRLNHAPMADAGARQKVYIGESATLSGAASDPDGDPIVSWRWTLVSKPVHSKAAIKDPERMEVDFKPDRTGEYVFSLIAGDGVEESAGSLAGVSVIVNSAPVASIKADLVTGPAPLTVSFDGSGSTDADGGELAYYWTFSDGSSKESGVSPTHTFSSPGEYLVVHTVVDDRGQASADTMTITVTAPVAEAPAARQ